ncbi:hypothetical protein K431DRAFT_245520 [Polychaeton citri CBS 116435]|uniref:SAGA-associated factor 11 n=1 Tax=Polychaeton citri CBS 116435 TaxID=1314669 RepID=A0A9P4UNC7_9PEZI|nr:hypothetical protein K431DRAFT_245520 [Polychaeton citri CBS 116435]
MSKDQPTLAFITEQLFAAALENIVHEIVLSEHKAHRDMVSSLDTTSRLPICDKCNLPQLLDPPLAPKVRGTTTNPPKETQYCDRRPWARRAGHDIYDNPFLKSDITGRPPTKKEREAAAAAARAKKEEGTPEGTEKDGTGPNSPSRDDDDGNDKKGGAPQKLEKGEKKASKIDEKLKKGEYVPWHTCPSCKRSLLITRFAKHLEQCMGLSGRAASRNAMAKMNGSTPSGSRSATPAPGQDGGGRDGNNGGGDDEDDDLAVKGPGGVRKKLLKKGMKDKLKKSGEKLGANGKLPKSLAASSTGKRPPKDRASPAASSAAGDKRERDDADDDDEESLSQVRKRQKLQRMGSTVSLASLASAGADESVADLERVESQDQDGDGDASFVDDGELGSGGDD